MRALTYKRYLLILLMAVAASCYVDRVALSIALQQIKVDLHLSDTQLGLLTGVAFALFYSSVGIPIARWADRGNRVTIITVTATLWSAMVALTGCAASFSQLLLVRACAGVGEAGCVPPANSLIPDYFTRAERPRAVGIYMMGGFLALTIGYFAAGWLNQLYGWRVMFVLIGLPGLLLAGLARLTLKEPRRMRRTNAAAGQPDGAPAGQLGVSSAALTTDAAMQNAVPTTREVVAALWKNSTFRQLLMCYSVAYFFGYGTGQWLPTFFIRSYGFQTGRLGLWFALTHGIVGLAGTYGGGVLAARYAPRNERLQFRVMAGIFYGSALVWTALFLAHNAYVDFALLAVSVLAAAAVNGPLFAAIQSLVPPRMRAMAIAIVYLFANLIGLGLGPLSAGALSDALRAHFGAESLRYALLLLCPGYAWAGWHLWRGARTVGGDLAAMRDEAVSA